MPSTAASTYPRARSLSLAGLSVLGAGLAAYLATIAWRQKGLPLGCGPEGGCAEVLGSRWSTLGPVPVGLLAVPVYLLLLLLAVFPATQSAARLKCGAGLLVAAALWFVGLQVFVLQAYCPWCLAEHAVGVITAIVAWRLATALPSNSSLVSTYLSLPIAMGAMSFVAIAQCLLPAPTTTARLALDRAQGASPGTHPATADAHGNADEVIPALAAQDRATVSLLQGQLTLDPLAEPRIGDTRSSLTLYLMFDYCCPHCRRTHEYLQLLLQAPPQPFTICCLPAPRAAACNPEITETEPRFEHACELAALALAVWHADSAKFAEFDRWLFASAAPREPAEASAEAERLVGQTHLAAALADGRVASTLRRNVDAFNGSAADYLPVLLAPGMAPIVGRPESREALIEILSRDFFH